MTSAKQLVRRLALGTVGAALLAYGSISWYQSMWVLRGALSNAWIVHVESWLFTLVILATPFLGVYLLFRAWRGS